MTAGERVDRYLEVMIAEGLYSTKEKLRFHLESTFEGVGLEGKSVVDIGGGSGLHSFYAASCGAREVVCLDPEAAGSHSGMHANFRRLGEALGYDNVRLEPVTFQDFDARGNQFDVMLLHDSINHLDEPACVTLLTDADSRRTYREIFARMAGLAMQGGKLVVCDCSRNNFFGHLKLRNPFVPTIEWHKHQAPRTWANLLLEAGFTNPRVRWSSFNRLGKAGIFLTGNRVAAYFLSSHFRLTMDR